MENQVNQHEIEAKKLQNSKDRVQKATGNRGKIITESKRQKSEHGIEAQQSQNAKVNQANVRIKV